MMPDWLLPRLVHQAASGFSPMKRYSAGKRSNRLDAFTESIQVLQVICADRGSDNHQL